MNQDKIEKISNASTDKNTLFEKIKPYLKIYRNNRDIVITLYSAVWFFFCTYVVCLANSYADRTNTNVNNTTKDIDYIAPDLILKPTHEYFLYHTWIPRGISDILVRCSAAFIIIRAITLKSYSLTVARRILLIMGFLYLLRACFIPLTVLPTPWVECKKGYKDNIFWDALLLELQIRMACGDVFFSGHTIMFTLNIMEYWYYCKNKWLKVFMVIINIFGMFTLIMSSYHYSIDVFAAFLFSMIFWVIYHWAVQIPQLQGTWWGSIINWVDDPYYFERSSLPLTYEQNPNGDGRSNVTDITDLSRQQKFDVADNIKDLDSASPSSPVNEITLLYELNKEQQRNNSIKKNNSNKTTPNETNNNDLDGYLSEEEKIYKRKSVLSDLSIDNISNLNLNPSLNNLDVQPIMDGDSPKKEKYLSPTYRQTSKFFKHHSINSLLSNNSFSSDNSNSPSYLSPTKHHSNLSLESESNLHPNISLGNSLPNSNSSFRSLPQIEKPVKKDSNSNSGSINNLFIVKGQSLSPIQSPTTSFEHAQELMKDSSSYYSRADIVTGDSQHETTRKPGSTSQFKKNKVEALTIDSVHEPIVERVTHSPTDITDQYLSDSSS